MHEPSVKRNVLLIHLSFWCVYISFLIFQMSTSMNDHYNWFKMAAVLVVILGFTTSLAYINYFFLMPKFLGNKKIVPYAIKLLALFAAAIFLRLQLERYIVDGYSYQAAYLYKPRFIVYISFNAFLIVMFVGMLRFATDWFELEKKRKDLQNQKLTAELTFLKAQINPHFLFNTLNNLYYLAYKQSPNTTEVISKLSQMMRYMIYDANHEKVPLSKEIDYMRNYITLEKLRINEDIPISFKISGKLGNLKIEPFILITFLENAFKHGISNNKPGAWIDIKLKLTNNECLFTLENSIFKGNEKEKGGIGLQNVRRRLELSYEGRHELLMKEFPEKYFVQLKLLLN